MIDSGRFGRERIRIERPMPGTGPGGVSHPGPSAGAYVEGSDAPGWMLIADDVPAEVVGVNAMEYVKAGVAIKSETQKFRCWKIEGIDSTCVIVWNATRYALAAKPLEIGERKQFLEMLAHGRA